MAKGRRFPVQADFRSGNTVLLFDGVVNDPMKMGGVDLRLKFSGDSLGDLYEPTGVLLPDTPPFETDGRLVAKIDTEKSSVFDYRVLMGELAIAISTVLWSTPESHDQNWKVMSSRGNCGWRTGDRDDWRDDSGKGARIETV